MNHAEFFRSRFTNPFPLSLIVLIAITSTLVFTGGCKKEAKTGTLPPAQVTVIKVEPKDTPVVFEFVGQTKSSHQVEIRARVNGFLDKRIYTEGAVVKTGEVMFKMDPKPFQAQLDAAQAALVQQQARLRTAQLNLARVIPLTEQNALSQKDLDDATGQEQTAAAAVEAAKAEVEQAKLNLGYCTITAPLAGLSSYARVQEGAYVNQQNSLLTYVAQTDPIWVNFSISENDILKFRRQAMAGLIKVPKGEHYQVEIILADGFVYPRKGVISFSDAEYNQQTGTFLVRSTLSNPKDMLRPGQFVTVHLLGAVRPNAVAVPQRAVQQGAKGHFIWVVGKENKVEARPVVIGDWIGNDVFVEEGLRAGEQVIVDGALTLSPGAVVVVKPYTPTPASAAVAPKTAAEKPVSAKSGIQGR
ncbi:MAG: efflux RND transporter periplasmic adaptor subunit [Proteobacteria bacterium]|nr:efflux RND transporter periplasmic adaptor subunit [Pseudomonadota bacterium]